MEGVGIAPLRSVVFGLVVVLLSLIAPAARAQVKDVAPSQVVVSRDKAEMRCGSDRTIYYKSGEVAAGTVLTIDGEMGEWARVSYPPKATAFVATNSVRYDEAAGTATLIEASRLYAENAVAGHPGSWKTLLANPLPAGTVLKVTAPAKDEQGRVIAYHVVPPASARAFIKRADLRPATPEEARAAGQPAAQPAKPVEVEAPRPGRTDDTPRPGAAPQKDANETATPQGPAQTQPQATDAASPPGNSLVEPMVKPGETPPPAPASTDTAPPTPVEPATPAPAPDQPAATDAATATPAPAPKGPTLMDLERTFEVIRRQSPNEAEYQALIDEFRRFQNAVEPSQTRLRNQIQGRIDWLEMKLEIAEYQRKLEDMKRTADSQSRDVGTKLAELERQRQYAIVGRLLPSTVYDGTNLPLMYRLQSVTGGMVPRTIGYLKPDPALDLPTKLNQVVGIIGEVKMDPGMTLNMISAQRVDVLQSTDGGPARNP